MSNGLKAFLFLVVSTFFMSCSTSKKTVSTNVKKRSVKFLMRQLENNHIDYNWFGSRGKVKIVSEKRKATLSVVVRMQKDSLIWIKIKKLNIEGARIKITPERIEIIDRQESTYTRKPFSFLKDEFGLELSFSELQELLIGNPILHKDKMLISAIRDKQNVLKTPESKKTVLQIFMNPSSFLINEVRGSMNNNSINITYDEYEEIDTEQIPIVKEVEVDSEDLGIIQLKISFSKVVLNEVQKVGFNIPDSYQRL